MAQNHLAKESKIAIAQAAIMAQDLQAMVKADHEDVRNLKAKHLGGGWAQSLQQQVGETPVGDIIVCDDYSYNEPPPVVQQSSAPNWMKGALVVMAGVLAAAGTLYGNHLLNKPSVPGITNTRIESKEGFIVELVPNEPDKK